MRWDLTCQQTCLELSTVIRSLKACVKVWTESQTTDRAGLGHTEGPQPSPPPNPSFLNHMSSFSFRFIKSLQQDSHADKSVASDVGSAVSEHSSITNHSPLCLPPLNHMQMAPGCYKTTPHNTTHITQVSHGSVGEITAAHPVQRFMLHSGNASWGKYFVSYDVIYSRNTIQIDLII